MDPDRDRESDSAPEDGPEWLDPDRESSSPVCYAHLFSDEGEDSLPVSGQSADPERGNCWKQVLRLKRIYDPAAPDDGARVLVDRVWPRGIRKEEARLEAWLKDLAPERELRQWFGHDPARWPEFRRRYHVWLDTDGAARAALEKLRALLDRGPVTLLFAARDQEHNNAAALADYLRGGKV